VSYNIPNVLSLLRLLLAFLLPILVVWWVPKNSTTLHLGVAFLFMLIGLTDFFDGYIARRWHQESLIGKLLDPLADKCLVIATMIALVAVNRISYVWALLFIGREFFVMGLREISLAHGVMLSVAWPGKVKTALQMLYLCVVLVSGSQPVNSFMLVLERGLLSLAVFYTVYSAVVYYNLCYPLLYL